VIAFGVRRSAFEVLVPGSRFSRTRTQNQNQNQNQNREPRTANAERRTPNASLCHE